MAVEWTEGGIPYLSDESLIGDVPEYTQLLAQGGGVPVGSVMMWVNKTRIPEFWLPLDGSVTDLSPYPKLAALFPSGLPNAQNLRPRGAPLASAGGYDLPAMHVNQLAPHCHDISGHSHITDVGRDHQGATTLAGSPHAPNGSFPISSRGSNANRPTQAMSGQSIYNQTHDNWAYDASLITSGANAPQPLHRDILVIYIIKAA